MNRTIVTMFMTATLVGLSPTLAGLSPTLAGLSLSALISRANPQDANLKAIEESLKDDVPRVLCLNKDFATAGQPKAEAFAKLAKQGFRAVLNLRTADEGAEAERELVEKAGMRYLNIPVVSANPNPEQVPGFIKAVKEPSNQPMLIHCGSAQRVGAFWMIYRVTEQGWPEEKALEEATKIGLTRPELIKFAKDYIASRRK
jgi:uncharacterized protein (TIGR01244 family)